MGHQSSVLWFNCNDASLSSLVWVMEYVWVHMSTDILYLLSAVRVLIKTCMYVQHTHTLIHSLIVVTKIDKSHSKILQDYKMSTECVIRISGGLKHKGWWRESFRVANVISRNMKWKHKPSLLQFHGVGGTKNKKKTP